ncbi:ankyrin repeat-containing protein [Tanacetum coccineum]
MLHIAVGIGKNDFIRKLLNFIEDAKQIEKQNADGCTAMHIAAIVGNKHAAELLVKKRKDLLGISDHKAFVPLLSAYYNMQLTTFVYLLEANDTKQQPLLLGLNIGSGVQTGVNLLITAIYTKQYDLASRLVDIYPELATNDDQVLTAIAKSFPSELEFGEALIYPFGSSPTLNALFPVLCGIFHPVEVGLIKRIEKKKKDYKEAKKILNSVCNQIDKLSLSGSHHPCYRRPILESTCQGAYEVVDEILFRSPNAIDSKNENGLNIIQLAVINRSKKIYNVVYHIVERINLYRTNMDSSKNNITTRKGKKGDDVIPGDKDSFPGDMSPGIRIKSSGKPRICPLGKEVNVVVYLALGRKISTFTDT